MKKDAEKEILETVNFIKDRMVTKSELHEELKLVRDEMATKDGLRRVEMKVEGVYKRLDGELDKRKTLEVRVGAIEQNLLGN
jgi:hypothetical protein